MFLASNCTCAVYFTYTAQVQSIKQTPYAFVAKIILCMYLLYGIVDSKILKKHDIFHTFTCERIDHVIISRQ